MELDNDLTVHCRSESVQGGFDAVLSLIELEYPDALIVCGSALGSGAALGAAQLSDNDLIPIITISDQSTPNLNSYPVEYLDFDGVDAVKKCWRLLQRRLKHPKASPEITHPAWNF